MLRDDLAEARNRWIADAKSDPQEYAQRQQSDFLADTNHEGQVVDFHSLRHTCGAWLAMAGEHPKTIQTVMRHSTITLTMDTYGHLFPGQEAGAIERLEYLFIGSRAQSEALASDCACGGSPCSCDGLEEKVATDPLQSMHVSSLSFRYSFDRALLPSPAVPVARRR